MNTNQTAQKLRAARMKKIEKPRPLRAISLNIENTFNNNGFSQGTRYAYIHIVRI